jgi:DNA-directed RNA polymerase specialized sigma24 family protein
MKNISYKIKNINNTVAMIDKNKEPEYYYNLLYKDLNEVCFSMLNNHFRLSREDIEDILQDYFIGTGKNKENNYFIKSIRTFDIEKYNNYFKYVYYILHRRAINKYNKNKKNLAIINSERIDDGDVEYFLNNYIKTNYDKDNDVSNEVLDNIIIDKFNEKFLKIICTSSLLTDKYAIALFIFFYLNINDSQINLSKYLEPIIGNFKPGRLNMCVRRGIITIRTNYLYIKKYNIDNMIKYLQLKDINETINKILPEYKNLLRDFFFKKYTINELENKYGNSKVIVNYSILKLFNHYKGKYHEKRHNNRGRITWGSENFRSFDAIYRCQENRASLQM